MLSFHALIHVLLCPDGSQRFGGGEERKQHQPKHAKPAQQHPPKHAQQQLKATSKQQPAAETAQQPEDDGDDAEMQTDSATPGAVAGDFNAQPKPSSRKEKKKLKKKEKRKLKKAAGNQDDAKE